MNPTSGTAFATITAHNKINARTMKKLKHTLIAIIALAAVKTAGAQGKALHNQQVTLHHYMFSLDSDLLGYNPACEDPMDLDWIGANPVEEMLRHTAYDGIHAAVTEATGAEIMPVEALEGKVMYDIYGYPMGGKKKAARRGNTPYYMKLIVNVTARDIITDEFCVDGVTYQRRRIRPHVSVAATFYNDQARPVFKVKGRAKSRDWIFQEQAGLVGIVAVNAYHGVDHEEPLVTVLDAAIEDLKRQLR